MLISYSAIIFIRLQVLYQLHKTNCLRIQIKIIICTFVKIFSKQSKHFNDHSTVESLP